MNLMNYNLSMLSSSPCTLYLVRHGETLWNAKKVLQGHTDIPLNATGEAQARARGESLKDIHFDAVYSSDLIRAKRTAEIITLERNLAITTTQALRERNFGTLEGKHSDVHNVYLLNLLAHYNSHPELKEAQLETNDRIIARVFTFLREISIAHQGESVLVASHGGVIRQVLIHLGFAVESQLPAGSIQNTAYIKLACDGVDFWIMNTVGIELAKE